MKIFLFLACCFGLFSTTLASQQTFDEILQILTPLSPQPLPQFEFSQLFPSSKRFIGTLTSTSKPVLLKNGPSAQWPAIKQWNQDTLKDAFEGTQFKVHKSQSEIVRMHSSVSPMGQLEGVLWNRPWVEEKMTLESFFENQQDRLYLMVPYQNLTDNLKKDVEPRAWLTSEIMPGSYQFFELLESNLWLGKPAITTPLHYDIPYNFYTQISGKKAFLLTSPQLWKHLCLFPRVHPSSRMSQIPWGVLDLKAWGEICPAFQKLFDSNEFEKIKRDYKKSQVPESSFQRKELSDQKKESFDQTKELSDQKKELSDQKKESSDQKKFFDQTKEYLDQTKEDLSESFFGTDKVITEALQDFIYFVVLEPGDMLFLPPYWGHHVSALDQTSVSVSAHLRSPYIELRESLNSIGIQVGQRKDLAPVVLFRLIKALVRVFPASEQITAKYFVTHLKETRYDPLQKDDGATGLIDVLNRGEILWEDIPDLDQNLPANLKRGIAEVVEKLEQVLNRYPLPDQYAIFFIELENWVEDHISLWVGPNRALAFLNEVLFYLNL